MQINFVWIGVVIAVSGVRGAPGFDVPVPADSAFSVSWDEVNFDHALWTRALAAYVNDRGLVDYGSIRTDPTFREYLFRLATTNPESLPTNDARLAFWINAYNALVIQGVTEMLPEDRGRWATFSVLDVKVPGITKRGKGLFAGLRFQVGGRRYTLDEIEKALLLRKPEWISRNVSRYRSVAVKTVDPRVHFVLVCAARGCPKLRREAYDPKRVQPQLVDAVRRFLRDPDQARLDLSARTMKLSQLLEWYATDFTNPRHTPHAESLAVFLAEYVGDAELARVLASKRWHTSYMEYDWKLNVQR